MKTPPTSAEPPDQDARVRIVRERARNVVVIAGAGTGKTKTIIDRAVETLAPTDDDRTAIPIQRMAAITFTRRAAGELRFRLRERLLRELEYTASAQPRRAEQLRAALGSLDAAFIGTIHGFADRLLRLRPVEAELSPSFTLVEDNADLVRETLTRLRQGAERGTLAADLGRFAAELPAGLVAEAGATLRAAVESGVQIDRAQATWGPLPSIEETVAQMIATRDVDLEIPPVPDPALEEAVAAVTRFTDMVARLRGGAPGVARLRRIARALQPLASIHTPAAAIRLVNDAVRGRTLFKGRDFNDDGTAWGLYKTIHPDKPRDAWILAKLKGPHRWLATRLVRLAPVACAMYEQIKAEHEVVDYLDLLIKLRRLLRADVEARHFYQGLFDHLFIDEFQDTDPLQCEIVFYLCGADGLDPAVTEWDQIEIAPGKLTIVGDPKQSIYRFRRADIAMYSRAVERLVARGALRERLATNFRSRAPLIDFFNAQLARLLGRDPAAFDPDSGRAAYEDLTACGAASSEHRAVHIVPYSDSDGAALLAPRGRAVEAMALARYIRWLLERGIPVRDVDSGAERPLQLGDIAVLASVTTQLPLLLRELDALDIPYTARGGALFLGHPVIRRFLLALRSLADRHDGVAEAALLQPPFFALDWDDHIAGHIYKKAHQDERRARLEAARDITARLRARRHSQSPGATARDLIEQTALGRFVATSRNGAQTLTALYEVAQEADRRAALANLEYDAVAEIFRTWADSPTFIETPEPSAASAVRVMTIHSAKGLEFPAVILWDGFQRLTDTRSSAWHVDRDGRSWALGLGPVSVEHPHDGISEREKKFGIEEKKRMYYVAATRARDLLAIPLPTAKGRWEYATATLVEGIDPEQVEILPSFQPGRPPSWAAGTAVRAPEPPLPAADIDAHVTERISLFRTHLERAQQPSAQPRAVTALAAESASTTEETNVDSIRVDKASGARFGTGFGLTVHRALELALAAPHPSPQAAVAIAAREQRLGEHLDEATADVERSLSALRAAGLTPDRGTIATEYPLAGMYADNTLVSGFVDFLHAGADTVSVIDFKTDKPRSGSVGNAYRNYARQLEIYGELLATAGITSPAAVKLGLLFTASGEIRWHTPTSRPK